MGRSDRNGAFVYQLGHGPLKAERRVRFPYALPLPAPSIETERICRKRTQGTQKINIISLCVLCVLLRQSSFFRFNVEAVQVSLPL